MSINWTNRYIKTIVYTIFRLNILILYCIMQIHNFKIANGTIIINDHKKCPPTYIYIPVSAIEYFPY